MDVQALPHLISTTPERPEEVALAIAADEYPGLRDELCRHRLDAMGRTLALKIARSQASAEGGEPLTLARVLCDFLHKELGFRGSDDYDDPRNNFFNDVLDRRTGSPVAMAVLHMAVGRRAGIDVEGIAFPGHFLVRIEGLYADPFEGGVPIDRERLLALAFETLGDRREAMASLEPVGPRTIAVRLLLNLQRIHRSRADHARAMVVCDRLYDVTRAATHLVDRGVHALALGATRVAIHDFEAYLSLNPGTDGAKRVRDLLRKARAVGAAPIN